MKFEIWPIKRNSHYNFFYPLNISIIGKPTLNKPDNPWYIHSMNILFVNILPTKMFVSLCQSIQPSFSVKWKDKIFKILFLQKDYKNVIINLSLPYLSNIVHCKHCKRIWLCWKKKKKTVNNLKVKRMKIRKKELILNEIFKKKIKRYLTLYVVWFHHLHRIPNMLYTLNECTGVQLHL